MLIYLSKQEAAGITLLAGKSKDMVKLKTSENFRCFFLFVFNCLAYCHLVQISLGLRSICSKNYFIMLIY